MISVQPCTLKSISIRASIATRVCKTLLNLYYKIGDSEKLQLCCGSRVSTQTQYCCSKAQCASVNIQCTKHTFQVP